MFIATMIKRLTVKNMGKDGFKDCVQSLVSDQYQRDNGCIPPWFTENLLEMCNQTISNDKEVNISASIFPTFDQTFLQVCTFYIH